MTNDRRADAVAAMDRAFGLGVEAAHEVLRENSGAKRIYDCAIVALASAIAGSSTGVADAPGSKRKEPRELAARALCRRDGHPENTKFEGKPMWMSYLGTVDLVLAEAGTPGMDRDDLIAAIKGSSVPRDNIMRELETLGLGSYRGGFHDEWRWGFGSAWDTMSCDALAALYRRLKDEAAEARHATRLDKVSSSITEGSYRRQPGETDAEFRERIRTTIPGAGPKR